MKELLNNFRRTRHFLAGTKAYFRDVVLVHLLIIFVLTPFLASTTQFILNQGGIAYISYDNFGDILIHHPLVFIGLISILLLMILLVFFEFTFLIQSIYFIQIRQPVSLKQLIYGTFQQVKKLNLGKIVFFFFYFFLILPISGIKFNTELLSKLEIPTFILDVIFENRVPIIALVIASYILLVYLAIRLIFALPEMIFNDCGFKEAIQKSWRETKNNFLRILMQFAVIMGSISLLTVLSYTLIIFLQAFIETSFTSYCLISATVLMTIMQFVWLLNTVLSTVGIFFVIIDYMENHHFLPKPPRWYRLESKATTRFKWFKIGATLILFIGLFATIGLANQDYLKQPGQDHPLTISHRGVDNQNAVQNSIEALKLTHETSQPDYVEMDIQETKDHQFVVYHDFKLKALTGIPKKPYEMNLADLTKLTVTEKGQSAQLVSFDDYLKVANEIGQKLLIEFKTTKHDSPDMVKRFTEMYREKILENGHIFQALDFDIVEKLKLEDSNFYVGYVMPFSIVGPPKGLMDFYSIEYTTLNTNFITSAHDENKKVYVWTPNDEDTMSRMMFYGVDGIITDRVKLLSKVMRQDQVSYSDKMLYLLIGIG